MKRLKRIAALLFALFLAFAPPGTLIGLALLIAWLGREYPVVVGALGLAAAAAAWLALRKRLARRRRRAEPPPPAPADVPAPGWRRDT
ncbi:MAG TPA: hypothetical protein VF746_18875 [Longimicrobium sp.]|jgi:uncharacterized membrane protein YfcA